MGCLIRAGIGWKIRKDLEKDTEILWIEVSVQKLKSILLCIVYRPLYVSTSDTSKYLDPNFLAKFDNMLLTGFVRIKKRFSLRT